MSINWNWQRLIIAIVAAITGWLSGIFVPAPGNMVRPDIEIRK